VANLQASNTVGAYEAKTHLSKLLDKVAAGEEITIARAGVPVARLIAVKQKPTKHRPLGMDRGKVWIADDFDAPLPDDLLKTFYGGRLPKIGHPKRK
jgi:prevent-host-death family protein